MDSNIILPTTNNTYGTTITWSSSDTSAISNTGVYGNPYVDTLVTLTATVSYMGSSEEATYDVVAKRYYSDLGDGVSIAYMYFSNSTASDNTYQNIDIVVFAHAKINSSAEITNISTLASYLPSRVSKCHNNGTYAILSFGMLDSDGLAAMSTVAANPSLRATLINNIISAINTYNLDGVDIDWEFPATSEKTNFTLFMKELRTAVKLNNPHHLVLAATGIDSYPRYDFENSAQYIDYISIMTYDMQNSSIATHQSALTYASGKCYKAVNNAYTYYVTNSGISPNKLILGIPFYGRKFTNTSGLGSSATAAGPLEYSTIVSTYLSDNNYIQYWDNNCQVPYLYSSIDQTFITYDNEASIALKAEYAASHGMAGLMYWQDAQDSGDVLFNAIIQGMDNNKLQFSHNCSGLIGILRYANNENVIKKTDVTLVNNQNITTSYVGSVTKYGFVDYSIDTSKMIADGTSSYGRFTDINLVSVHDTGNAASGSTAAANANYMLTDAAISADTSWHYTVGNDGIYQDMSEEYTSYHAGCGARVFSLEDSGVNANKYGNVVPTITINASGYYCINGEATTLKPYTDTAGTVKTTEIYTTNQITPSGIYYSIGANGNYYLNKTYYNSTYGYIANFGGNKNAIGIESAVNSGSDLYLTYQKLAKLVADVLVRNDLTPHEVVPHNAFSGKDCPHAMFDADMWDEFIKMVEIEYYVKKYYSDYNITFASLSPTIINDNGRLITNIDTDITVYYKITITKNELSEVIVLSSTIPV